MSVPNGLTSQAEITGQLNLECGVVVVGSGAGGATVAAELAEAGVDVIVAQGTEAAAHCGEVSTMVLVPEVVDAVHPTPVLAAGGIGGGSRRHRPGIDTSRY